MTRLLLATRNEGKARELRDLLRGEALELETLATHPEVGELDETGTSFEENAELKARQCARAAGCWALGEDSGLMVDALGGEPGVRSARYAGIHGDDAANIRRLLRALEGVRDPSGRRARFVCTMALADPRGRVVARVRGVCEGRIAFQPRGENGFGYDPCFVLEGEDVTMAELRTREKALVSHRAHALRTILPVMRHHLGLKPDASPLR
jgi:XTP/dITP diphosphohydrolase